VANPFPESPRERRALKRRILQAWLDGWGPYQCGRIAGCSPDRAERLIKKIPERGKARREAIQGDLLEDAIEATRATHRHALTQVPTLRGKEAWIAYGIAADKVVRLTDSRATGERAAREEHRLDALADLLARGGTVSLTLSAPLPAIDVSPGASAPSPSAQEPGQSPRRLSERSGGDENP
jgi:hypothetical protein